MTVKSTLLTPQHRVSHSLRSHRSTADPRVRSETLARRFDPACERKDGTVTGDRNERI
ncbi:Uncharacterized protein DAT39_008992 [Clarias magur]|uniref:Uncharacterized protein n=1 Tax=Clarias magur TaxID=1594786 RepID=A0A8J4U9I9_CLAMG|nr:Uncharacterized protein DAT39_008992 [Clarias magur]